MTLQEIKEKKRTGDTENILNIVNAKRIECGLKPRAFRTVKSMLNGDRKLKDDVSQAAEVYYSVVRK